MAFANAAGGRLVIGIEDGDGVPRADQRIDAALVDRVRKRIGELTVNVQVHPEIRRADNGAEVLVVHVPRAHGVASTSDGRYYLRVGDQSQPVVGDNVLRLASERPQAPWETLTSQGVPRAAASADKLRDLVDGLRASDRVKSSVKEKTDNELLDHYGLAAGPLLTNLGVLLLGTAVDRARLGSAPVIQAIKYDADGVKVDKHVWDDHALSPVELVDAVWEAVPDFRERYEVPDGMFRAVVPAYEEVVVRELLVNALVHRPYTQLRSYPLRNQNCLPVDVCLLGFCRQSRLQPLERGVFAMKKLSWMMLVPLLAVLSGCAMAKAPVTGFIYTDAKTSEHLSSNTGASKLGTACATSILGWIGSGDASIAAAARDGGITKVAYVDSHATNVLGIYAKYCTEVRGE